MTTEDPTPPPQRTEANKAEHTRLIGGIVISIIAIWFVVANTHKTSITFWVVTVTSPMWLALAGTFLAGMLASLLLTRTRTRNKPKQ